MKKHFGFLLAGIMSAQCAFAATSKQACGALENVVKEIQAQTPMDVDYMTTLTGAQAIYAGGRCLLNYSYVIKSDFLLKDMMKENDLSKEQNLAFLATDDGALVLKNILGEQAKNMSAQFESLSNVKGMKITYTHSFDDAAIKPVVSVVMNNEI